VTPERWRVHDKMQHGEGVLGTRSSSSIASSRERGDRLELGSAVMALGVRWRVRCRGFEGLRLHQKVGDGEAGIVARSEGSRWSGASAIARRSFGGGQWSWDRIDLG
jgi:hypothetical protein